MMIDTLNNGYVYILIIISSTNLFSHCCLPRLLNYNTTRHETLFVSRVEMQRKGPNVGKIKNSSIQFLTELLRILAFKTCIMK